MNKTITILLVVTLTFGLILAATNFAVSAVAQTVTTGGSVNGTTAMDNATNATTATTSDNATNATTATTSDNATNATTATTSDNATGGNNTKNPLSNIPIIGDLFK
jgi:hypothetical protein